MGKPCLFYHPKREYGWVKKDFFRPTYVENEKPVKIDNI